MPKQLEKLKKQLAELSEPINFFNSETVQLKVITRVLMHLDQLNEKDQNVLLENEITVAKASVD